MKTQKHRKNAGEDGDRDWSDVPTSQGVSRIAHCLKNPGKRHGTVDPSGPSKRTDTFHTLIFDSEQ